MKYLKLFKENFTKANCVEINDTGDLAYHIEDVYPNIRNLVHGTADTAMEYVTPKVAWEQACYSFYETLLEDEKEGYIKLSLSEEEVLKWISEYCS